MSGNATVRTNLGAVAIGAMAGLAGAMLLFSIMGIFGLVDSRSDAVPFLFLQFVGLVAAGYVSGRLAGRDHVPHGGYAGLLLFFVATGISIAGDPGPTSLLVVSFTGLLALVLGSAGGALARVREDR